MNQVERHGALAMQLLAASSLSQVPIDHYNGISGTISIDVARETADDGGGVGGREARSGRKLDAP